MIETARLVLRPAQDADRQPLAAVNGDPRVGEWLGATLTPEENDRFLSRVQAHIAEHGFGLWAVVLKGEGAVIGMAGLMTMSADLPPGPAIEVGWRLAPRAWDHGYATEAARAALAWGFANTAAPEIVAITARSNLRSQGVMRRLGMAADPARAFDHPKLPADHPLRPHVLFAAAR